MLDAFIIDEIRKREQEREAPRPRLDLPLPEPTRPASPNDTAEEGEVSKRGVVIIDYSIPAPP